LDGDGVCVQAVVSECGCSVGTDRGAGDVRFLPDTTLFRSSVKLASGTSGVPTLATGDYFGSSVASLGDLDGDGVTDLAVGAYKGAAGHTDGRKARVVFISGNAPVKRRVKIVIGGRRSCTPA